MIKNLEQEPTPEAQTADDELDNILVEVMKFIDFNDPKVIYFSSFTKFYILNEIYFLVSLDTCLAVLHCPTTRSLIETSPKAL